MQESRRKCDTNIRKIMKKLDKEELRKTQLNILQKVTSFCEMQDISYSLYGGTLLGAVRHKGYIPWDDDIDISMPRPDYERFKKEFCHIGESNLKIHDVSLNKNYPYPFIKVSDERTLFIENSNINYIIGVNIDIFPIDGLPESEKESNKLMRKSTFYRSLIELKQIRIRKGRKIYKNIFLYVSRLILFIIPVYYLIGQIIKLTNKNDFRHSSYVGNIVWGYGNKERCLKNIYSDYLLLEFERNKFRAMVGFDGYLTSVFGNYMEIPPKEKQIAHHSFDAFYK